jgi:hypothetical protein
MDLQKLMTSIIHNCEEVRENLCTIDFAEERELLRENIDTCKQLQNNVLQIFKVVYTRKATNTTHKPVDYYLAYNIKDVKTHIKKVWVPELLKDFTYKISSVKTIDTTPFFMAQYEE